jgi:hypothetical protein
MALAIYSPLRQPYRPQEREISCDLAQLRWKTNLLRPAGPLASGIPDSTPEPLHPNAENLTLIEKQFQNRFLCQPFFKKDHLWIFFRSI